MSEIIVQFSTSTAFTSAIIRRLTRSPWSHVDFVLPEGLLGVSGKDEGIFDPGGVRVRPHDCWPYLYPPKRAILSCSEMVARDVIEIAKSQIGKPFDNSALWRFLDDQANVVLKNLTPTIGVPSASWTDESAWICSELICFCLARGGFFPYSLVVVKNKVSPAEILLLLNPYMREENIREFLQLVQEQGI